MKKVKINRVVIFLLLALNIFLLYVNVERQDQITLLKSQLEFSFIERIDNFLNSTYISHPQIEFSDSEMSLMVFFPETSCPICIEYEVPKLNSIYQKYKSHINVYVIGKNDDDKLFDIYGAEFSYSFIHPSVSVFNKDIHFVNPFAILADPDGNVHTIYMSEIGNPQKSDQFWQRMSSFFQYNSL